MALGLSISVFIDQKGILHSTTWHEYLTDQALLAYTETKRGEKHVNSQNSH